MEGSSKEEMELFRGELRRGNLQRAYRKLLGFMTGLRAHLAETHPQAAISGLYQGYLDMTYFAIVPPAFKRRGLKAAIVFNYEAFRFEAWLAGSNRQIQRKYWELFREGGGQDYRLVTPAKGVDAIVETILAADPDFDDPERLTAEIEQKVGTFLQALEDYLSGHDPVEAE
jgi:hypothetical protein